MDELTHASSISLTNRKGEPWSRLARWIGHHPLGGFGAVVLAAWCAAAVLAPHIAGHDPNESLSGYRLSPPGWEHWFGTDNLARDLFARIVFGMRTTLIIASVAAGVGVVVGWGIGLVCGFVGGWCDLVAQRLVDICMALPGLVVALVLVAVLGPSMVNIVIAIAAAEAPRSVRVARGVALSACQEEYVLAARTIGASDMRIVLRHVLPATIAPMLIVATSAFSLAVLIEASLSFLGVGVRPPTPTLGGLLSKESRRFMLEAWWMAVFPGMAISLLVFAINVLGDALRDTWDPRLRGAGGQ